MTPNSRIDLRISNPEKAQWQEAADARGMTLTQLIKQSVRSAVAESNRLAAQGLFQTFPLTSTTNSANTTWTTTTTNSDEVA